MHSGVRRRRRYYRWRTGLCGSISRSFAEKPPLSRRRRCRGCRRSTTIHIRRVSVSCDCSFTTSSDRRFWSLEPRRCSCWRFLSKEVLRTTHIVVWRASRSMPNHSLVCGDLLVCEYGHWRYMLPAHIGKYKFSERSDCKRAVVAAASWSSCATFPVICLWSDRAVHRWLLQILCCETCAFRI